MRPRRPGGARVSTGDRVDTPTRRRWGSAGHRRVVVAPPTLVSRRCSQMPGGCSGLHSRGLQALDVGLPGLIVPRPRPVHTDRGLGAGATGVRSLESGAVLDRAAERLDLFGIHLDDDATAIVRRHAQHEAAVPLTTSRGPRPSSFIAAMGFSRQRSPWGQRTDLTIRDLLPHYPVPVAVGETVGSRRARTPRRVGEQARGPPQHAAEEEQDDDAHSSPPMRHHLRAVARPDRDTRRERAAREGSRGAGSATCW